MKEKNKTKKQLIEELMELRQRVAESEAPAIKSKRTKELSGESEGRYRMYFSNSPNGLFVVDSKGRYLEVNDTSCRMTGYSTEELMSMSISDLVAPDELEKCLKDFEKLLKTGCLSTELLLRRKDDTKFIIQLDAVKLSSGRYIGFTKDITKHKRVEEDLKESEEKYRTLYNDTPSMYFTLDKGGKVLSVNKFGAKQLGYTVEELEDQSVLKVFHQGDQKAVKENLALCLKTPEKISNWEFRKVCKDKTVIWVKETVRVIKDNKGKVNVLVVCENITNQKQAEEALLASEEKYRTIVESAGIPHSIIALDGTILFVNTVGARNLGGASHEFKGKSVYQLFPELADTLMERISKIAKSRRGGQFEDIVKLPSGARWFNSSNEPIIDDNGKVSSVNIISMDITDRKRAEESLMTKDIAIESAMNAIAFANLKGDLSYVNSSFLKQWGYSDKEEVLGKPAITFWQVEERAQEVVDRLHDNGSWEGELNAKRKDGSSFDTQLCASIVTDDFGRPICMMASFIDITKRKEAEEGLKIKSQELEELTQDLRKLSSQLSVQEESSRKKFAKILHEQVGQNLAAMKMKCLDIRNEHTTGRPKMKDVISNIVTMIDDTIGSTRRLTSELYPVVLDALGLAPAVSWYSDLVLKPRKVNVLIRIDDFVESLPSEYKLSFFRIIQESFHNIIKHASATEVKIELKKLDGSIRLTIKDNGIGYDMEKARKKESKGIGIMLMKERALSLSGIFEVKSDLNGGTKIMINIPL